MARLIFDYSRPGRSAGAQLLPPAPEADEIPDETPSVPSIGEEDIEELTAERLFDPAATSRIVVLWILTPTISVVGSYLLFRLLL